MCSWNEDQQADAHAHCAQLISTRHAEAMKMVRSKGSPGGQVFKSLTQQEDLTWLPLEPIILKNVQTA